ncbi:MAG: UDP-N-acetylmuramoyl-tripeptide--D-alanyl-D-alanine ligase [Cellulosilyticaceae bacterium]
MKLTLEQVLKATGGKCLNPDAMGNNLVTSIVIDSRRLEAGSLFVPIKGDNFDGHDFIAKAGAQGAVATLTEQADLPDHQLTTIHVADTRKALLDLAHYYRQILALPVIAVTGSVGKTTTKDLIASVLGAKFKVHKTQGNYNNEIGMPLTVFAATQACELMVLEMGMNHFDEIHRLSMTAAPNHAVITNIGTSHIENLGSREGILKAKLEIIDGLQPGGRVIVNGEDDLLGPVATKNPNFVAYGMDESHYYYATAVKLSDETVEATLVSPTERYDVVIPAPGEHMVYNALAALILAEAYDLTKEQVIQGFMDYVPTKMRMQIIQSANGMRLIDDTYNASPDSMKAALKVLASSEVKGKKVAVLGDMFEMGDHGPGLHREVGEYAASTAIDVLCAVGTIAKNIYEGAQAAQNKDLELYYYETQEDFLKDTKQFEDPLNMILFKASRGMHFENLVNAMRKVNDNE